MLRPLSSISTALIVEDNTLTVIILESQLSKHGIKVHKAFDGNAGWEACKNQHFDLLLIDLNIPLMNGKELIKNIRKETPDQGHTIAISAGLSEKEISDLLKIGFNECLHKPLKIQLLGDKLSLIGDNS